MDMNFIYSIPTKVYFGKDQLGNLVPELEQYGKKVLMVYGGGSIKKIGLYDKIMEQLRNSGLTVFEFGGIEPNPRHTTCEKAILICKKEKIDVLLAVGGGSVIDATKFIAAGTYYDGDKWDILTGKVAVEKALPIVDILTLSATGSEMDCASVITNLETHDKLGMVFSALRPKTSFLDPTNTFSVDKYQTACGGADILSHIFEVYFNISNDCFMLDTVMEGLMKTVIKYVPIAMKNPDNYEARANLMWTSSWAINDFIDGGKSLPWTCHPIEHELSAYYDITHGLGLAIVTPRWMKYCLNEKTVSKFYQFGVNVFGIDKTLPQMEVAKKAIAMVENFFFSTLELKSSLSEINIDDKYFKTMAEKAEKHNTIEAFQPLDAKDIEKILRMCL